MASYAIDMIALFAMATTALAVAPHGAAREGDAARREAVISVMAQGTFEVKMQPQAGAEPKAEPGSEATLTRFALDKQYAGDVNGEHFYEFEYSLPPP